MNIFILNVLIIILFVNQFNCSVISQTLTQKHQNSPQLIGSHNTTKPAVPSVSKPHEVPKQSNAVQHAPENPHSIMSESGNPPGGLSPNDHPSPAPGQKRRRKVRTRKRRKRRRRRRRGGAGPNARHGVRKRQRSKRRCKNGKCRRRRVRARRRRLSSTKSPDASELFKTP